MNPQLDVSPSPFAVHVRKQSAAISTPMSSIELPQAISKQTSNSCTGVETASKKLGGRVRIPERLVHRMMQAATQATSMVVKTMVTVWVHPFFYSGRVITRTSKGTALLTSLDVNGPRTDGVDVAP